MEFPQQEDVTIFDEFTINDEAKNQFTEIARWTRINAVISLVSLGMSVVAAVLTILKIRELNNTGSSIVIASTVTSTIITVGISLLMNIILLQASASLQKGLQQNDQGLFGAGIGKLAAYFRVFAVILIIAMVILVLVLLFTIVMISGRSI